MFTLGSPGGHLHIHVPWRHRNLAVERIADLEAEHLCHQHLHQPSMCYEHQLVGPVKENLHWLLLCAADVVGPRHARLALLITTKVTHTDTHTWSCTTWLST